METPHVLVAEPQSFVPQAGAAATVIVSVVVEARLPPDPLSRLTEFPQRVSVAVVAVAGAV